MLESEEPLINNIYISPSGQYISASHGGSGNATVWSASNAKQVAHFNTNQGWCNAALFLADEELLLTTGYCHAIRTMNWKSGSIISEFLIPNANNAYGLTMNNSQTRVATMAYGEKKTGKVDTKFCVWTFPGFELLLEVPFNRKISRDYGCLSPDGTKAVVPKIGRTGGWDLFDVDSGKRRRVLSMPHSPFKKANRRMMSHEIWPSEIVKFSPNGGIFVFLEPRIGLHLFDVNPASSTFGEYMTLIEIKGIWSGTNVTGALVEPKTQSSEQLSGRGIFSPLEFILERGGVKEN
jgi:WD40 repeat protein